MTKPSLADVPISSTSDPTSRWATLLDPPIFRARILWLMWLGADCRVLPVIVPVDDVPSVPEPAMTAGLLQIHDGVVAEHLGGAGHLALALCRPGQPYAGQDAERWAARLHGASTTSCRAAGACPWRRAVACPRSWRHLRGSGPTEVTRCGEPCLR